MKTNYKRIPFNIEVAKKIMNKQIKGRILTLEGREVRIVCWDKKPFYEDSTEYPIVAIAKNDCGGELLYTCTEEGLSNYTKNKNGYNLVIEIPTFYKDYSSFVPHKYQVCVVGDPEQFKWRVAVCAGKDANTGEILLYNEHGDTYSMKHILPLSKVTKRLIGTYKFYEELCEDLDQEMENKL